MDAKTAQGFKEIVEKKHTEQGIWFLNGFWDEGGAELGEQIFKYVTQFRELENDGPVIRYKGKKAQEMKQYVEGCDLDPHKSHRFLETLGETLTVVALRKKLEQIDLDKNKRMALTEYLLFKYEKTPKQLVEAPQGDNSEAIAAAQAQMNKVQDALAEVQGKLAEQTEQKEANDKALADLKAAKEELQAALAELKKEEDAFAAKKADLESKANDEGLGVVKRNRAKNQLAQMEAEDPLPLRKAKITQGAALKRTEKAEKKCAKTAAALEKAIEETEKAQEDLSKQMEEAEAELEICKKKGGVAHGAIWWMEKELSEARKFGGRKKK